MSFSSDDLNYLNTLPQKEVINLLLKESEKLNILKNEYIKSNNLILHLEEEIYLKTKKINEFNKENQNEIEKKSPIKKSFLGEYIIPRQSTSKVIDYEILKNHLEIQNVNFKEKLEMSNESIINVKETFKKVIDSLNQKILSQQETIKNLSKVDFERLIEKSHYEIEIISEKKENQQSQRYELLEEKLKNDNLTKYFMYSIQNEMTFNGIQKDLKNPTKIRLIFGLNQSNIPTLTLKYEGLVRKEIPINTINLMRIVNFSERKIELRYFLEESGKENYLILTIEEDPMEFINKYKLFSALGINLELVESLSESKK